MRRDAIWFYLTLAVVVFSAAMALASEVPVEPIVVVCAQHDDHTQSRGSGAAVDLDGDGTIEILTNAHVVGDRNVVSVAVWFPGDNAWSPATIRFAHKSGPDDLAILATARRVADRRDVLPIAAADAPVGAIVRSAGYAGGMVRQPRAGRVIPNRTVPRGATLTYTLPTVQGESGMPVLNDAGEIVALHWGGDGNGVGHGMTASRVLNVCRAAGCRLVPVQPAPRPTSQPAPTLSVGDTITGPPGSAATVRNVGTGRDVVLEFTIPQGTPGERGPTGRVALTDDEIRRVAELVFAMLAEDPQRLAALLPPQMVEISTGPTAAGGQLLRGSAPLGEPLRVTLPPIRATIRDGGEFWEQTRPLGAPLSFVVVDDPPAETSPAPMETGADHAGR